MTRSRSNSITSSASSAMTAKRPSAMARSAASQLPPVAKPKTLRQRVKSALLGGEKGAGLGYAYAYPGGSKASGRVRSVGKVAAGGRQENPVARLKLLLVRCSSLA